jgi:acyl-CoA synthetase (NDP forming)
MSAARAAARVKPVVVVKSGRMAQGMKIMANASSNDDELAMRIAVPS